MSFQSLEQRRLLAVIFVPSNDVGLSQAGSSQSLGSLVATRDGRLPFDIRFNFGPNIRLNPDAMETMEAAARVWESHIADPVTLFIDVELDALDGNSLGGAVAEIELVDYPTLRQRMIEDALGEMVVDSNGVASRPDRSGRSLAAPPIDDLDDFIVQHLPRLDQLRFNLPDETSFVFADGEGVPSSATLGTPIFGGSSEGGLFQVNRATLKSLGMIDPRTDASYLEPDGTIVLSNSTVTIGTGETATLLDFNRGNGIGPLQFDGLTVAIHEIAHILGFVSSVDTIGDTVTPTPLDLFRFPDSLEAFNPRVNPDTSAGNRYEQFETFVRELRPNVTMMTDFGRDYWIGLPLSSRLVEVPMAEPFGDQQTSHWREIPGQPEFGMMGPTLAPGVSESITAVDLRALDLIGWDIVSPAISRIDVTNLYVGSNQGSLDPRANPFDVDGNGRVTAADALLVINQLRVRDLEIEGSELSGLNSVADVNGDGKVSAQDALLVINYMNQQDASKEGEQVEPHDWLEREDGSLLALDREQAEDVLAGWF